jgi:hypothetical protein
MLYHPGSSFEMNGGSRVPLMAQQMLILEEGPG